MVHLKKSLQAWGGDGFETALKTELESLTPELLPLQQGLTYSSYVSNSGISAMIIAVNDDADTIHARAGIFYHGIIAGCNCADDPTPVDEQSEYCIVQIVLDKDSAEATFSLLDE
jgi:hypothetical protein